MTPLAGYLSHSGRQRSRVGIVLASAGATLGAYRDHTGVRRSQLGAVEATDGQELGSYFDHTGVSRPLVGVRAVTEDGQEIGSYVDATGVSRPIVGIYEPSDTTTPGPWYLDAAGVPRAALGTVEQSSTATSLWTPAAHGAAVWYDIQDLTTMFTDTAGTTPATVGQTVARINDKSGNGRNATQTTAGKRPTLVQHEGRYALSFDGADRELYTPSTIDFTATDQVTVMGVAEKTGDGVGQIIAELSANQSSNNGSWAMLTPSSASLPNWRFTVRGLTNVAFAQVEQVPAPAAKLFVGQCDISNDLVSLRLNGSQTDFSADLGAQAGFGNYLLSLGGRQGSTSLSFKGYITGLAVYPSVLSGDDLEYAETYMRNHCGL